MQPENDITPEVEGPDASDPAVAAILRERAKLDAALRTMGYVEPSADATPINLPDGFYPLHDFGTAPEVEAVEEAKVRLRDKEGPNQQDDGTYGPIVSAPPVDSPPVDTAVPPVGTNVPVDLSDERVIRDAWRGSSVNDREILVGLKSIGNGNIDAITNGTNAIFKHNTKVWTVRRAVYGSKTHAPAPGTLMHRGLVEQTDPSARGRIKYTLTDLGRKAVEYGGQQSS